MRAPLTLTNFSILLEMVTNPRKKIRKIIRIESRGQEIVLAILFGIDFTLSQLSFRNLGDFLPLPYVLMIAAIGGPVVGIVIMFLMGGLLHWTGNRLGGQASAEHLRAAYVWSFLPNLLALLLWLPQLLLLGTDSFTSAHPKLESNPVLALVILVFIGLTTITNVWSFILLLTNISEVQRFSIWRALGSLISSILILLGPIYCLLVLLQGFGLISYHH
jgi:hypothetical protein